MLIQIISNGERSLLIFKIDSIHYSMFDILFFLLFGYLKFQTSVASGSGATRLILEKTSELRPKIVVVGFRISKYHRQIVGWVECNETQQNLKLPQPNLQNVKKPEIKLTYIFEVSNKRHRWLEKQPVKSNEKLMNIESSRGGLSASNVQRPTSNIEHRIMDSVYFKTTERPVGS